MVLQIIVVANSFFLEFTSCEDDTINVLKERDYDCRNIGYGRKWAFKA